MNKKDFVFINQVMECKIVEQGVVYGDSEWNFKNIISPFHRIYYIEKGKNFVTNSNKTYELTEGNFYFIKRNTKMDYYAEDDFIQYYLHFKLPVLVIGDFLDNIDDVVCFKIPENTILEYKKFFNSKNIEDYFTGISIIYKQINKIINTASRYKPIHMPSDSLYLELLNYLNQNISGNITVGDMAKYCGQSISDFSRKFKREVGISPKAYLHKIILEKATELLVGTDLSIKQISDYLGIKDSLYFSRFFKNKYGLCPKDYRKSRIMSGGYGE